MKTNLIYFKGPSEEKILKRLEGKTLEEKFKLGREHKIKWLVNYCIDQGVLDLLNLNDKFIIGVLYNIPKLVKDCIKEGADPSLISNNHDHCPNNWSIWSTCEDNHIQIVKILLKDPRVDPNVFDTVTLYWAVRNENYKMIKLLLENHGIDPSPRVDMIYDFAYKKGYSDIISLIKK
jgi:hypothetical protein